MANADVRVGAAWIEAAGEEERRGWQDLRRGLRTWARNPLGMIGTLILAALVVMSLASSFVQRYEPDEAFYVPNPNYNPSSSSFFRNDRDATILDNQAAPTAKHWLGTDDGGRDIWSRLVWGTRRSLGIGVTSLAFGVAFGALLGLVSGYFGGVIDTAMQRLLDAAQAFPPLLLLILAATAFELTVRNLIIALAIVSVPQVSRLIRGSVLAVRAMPFVEAGRVVGASHLRIMFRHILPNVAASLIVVFTIGIGAVIIAEASLAFLALTPPGISWGRMLNNGIGFINVSPWQSLFSGAAITLAVLGFNLIGDALRDVLDPRLRI